MSSANPMRLLVVEDEGMLLLMLTDMLEELGHEVKSTAADIPTALGLIKDHGPDFDGCVLDANLGGRFATPIAKALRTAEIPFIIVSGYESRELQRLELTGPSVSKPYNMRDIQSALSQLKT